MTVIEISESKVSKMSDCVEEILNKAGEMMWMLEKLEGGSGWGEREGGSYGSRYGERGGRYGERGGRGGSYSNRGGYGSRGDMGYREDEWEMEDMNERRRRDSRGRFM